MKESEDALDKVLKEFNIKLPKVPDVDLDDDKYLIDEEYDEEQ